MCSPPGPLDMCRALPDKLLNTNMTLHRGRYQVCTLSLLYGKGTSMNSDVLRTRKKFPAHRTSVIEMPKSELLKIQDK